MKRTCVILALMMTFSWLMAQEEVMEPRGHIQNLTAYPTATLPTKQRRVGSLATAPLTCIGSPKVPVILVQFPDMPFSVGETEEAVRELYNSFFNAGEGVHPSTSYCSVKEYFRSQSGGLFTPDFDIIGPVTLEKSYTYYGEDKGGSQDIHISQFYREACQQALQRDVDWSLYDNNDNGTVDFVFFIYAGHGQNQKDIDSGAIWPKENLTQTTVDGEGFSVIFSAYGCANELFKEKMDGIGPCIHELCHGLGLPDFYDTNYIAYGLDYWDVMDSGCYKINGRMPIGLSAYELDFLGWRKLVELDSDSAYSLTIEPLEKEGVAYKVVNKENTDEYFILENRQNIGLDGYLGWATSSQYKKYGANHGLMITHVDFKQSAWNSNTVNTVKAHQRITLVPADGELISSLDYTDSIWANSVHGDLYPGENNVTEMSSYDVYIGHGLGQTIDNIVETEDGIITLDINGGKKEEEDPDPDPEGLYEPDDPEIACQGNFAGSAAV